MVNVAGVVLVLAYRPDCAQVIRLIHVLIKYDVIAETVNNVGVDSNAFFHVGIATLGGAEAR